MCMACGFACEHVHDLECSHIYGDCLSARGITSHRCHTTCMINFSCELMVGTLHCFVNLYLQIISLECDAVSKACWYQGWCQGW